MDIKEQLKDIKTQLRLSMNGAVSQSMREKGLVYKLNFGVELPRIKMIAGNYEKNHDLAQALWKEDIRECKILAGLLQPIDTFYPEIADIWVEDIRNIEIAELTCMNLFQNLPYAPAKSFHWIADEREYIQTCGFLTAARLLMKKGDMTERAAGELLDQAICAVHSESYHVRNAALLVIRKYMQHNEENAFRVCRLVEGMADSNMEGEQMLYNMEKAEMESLLSGVKNMLPTVVPAAETAGLAVMSFLWSMKERQHCWICATTARWLQSRAGTERQRKCMVPMGQTALSRCRRVRL